MQLTRRDHEIIRLVHRHRFLRSQHIAALLPSSPQQVVRRLQLLYHHGYLERPRAQLEYYGRGGSRPMVYGLGKKGAKLFKKELGIAASGGETNHDIGQIFLEHTLLVSDMMVSIELGCRKSHGVTLLYEDQLALPLKHFQWQVKIPAEGVTRGVVPDRVFALEYTDQARGRHRVYYFLEADRGTMPVVRSGSSTQTSINRKLIAYEATWTQKIHQRKLGIHRFRVLTVTTNAKRLASLLEACSRLKRGHGLFLFADRSVLEKDPLSPVWQCGKAAKISALLD